MTNEKAKDVLDFLARKAGYKSFNCPSCSNVVGQHMAVMTQGNNILFLYDISLDLSTCDPCYCQPIIITKTTYLKALNILFDLSSQGHLIDTMLGIYLEPYTTLEHVLIEMDLDEHSFQTLIQLLYDKYRC